MKKIKFLILPLLVIALFSLNSCTSEEPYDPSTTYSSSDPSNPTTPTIPTTPTTPTTPGNGSSVLLKKTITTYPDGEKTTTLYTYNGNKLVSIIDDSGELNVYFTYTGNLITKLEYKENGIIDQVDSFTYNSNGKIASFVREVTTAGLGTFIDSKETYTYNLDGSISVTETSGSGSTSTIKFENGEVSEIINSNLSKNHKYTYDTKNNPVKNVLGYDKISFYGGEADGILYNMISDISTQSYNYTYTYNTNNYPVTSTEIDNTGFVVKTEFFY